MRGSVLECSQGVNFHPPLTRTDPVAKITTATLAAVTRFRVDPREPDGRASRPSSPIGSAEGVGCREADTASARLCMVCRTLSSIFIFQLPFQLIEGSAGLTLHCPQGTSEQGCGLALTQVFVVAEDETGATARGQRSDRGPELIALLECDLLAREGTLSNPPFQSRSPKPIAPDVEDGGPEVGALVFLGKRGEAICCTRKGLMHQVFCDVFPTGEQDSQAQECHPMSGIRIAKLVLPVVHVHPGRLDHRVTRTRNGTVWLPARIGPQS